MYFVFNAEDFETNTDAYSISSDLELTYDTDDISDYITLTAAPGDYTNGNLLFTLKAGKLDVNPIEHHFIKIAYKTDLTHSSGMIDINCTKGDSWLNSGYKLTSDGEWHEVIIDLESILESNSAGRYPDADDSSTVITIKPWGSHEKTLASEQYLSIRYIAFFETKAEAEVYTFEERNTIDTNDFK